MREYLTAIAGNAALRQRLGRDLQEGSFAHAYILDGPAGCGKSTMAMELVKALACERRGDNAHALPCGTCPTCQKIAAGNCPDVIHVRREEDKTTMSVDVIRALRSDVITVPNDLSFKVYIVHEAHTMTIQAQNALLLTLEEPPSFVLFLLLAEDAGAMLETIRSRAPVLRMQPVADGEIRQYLLDPARDQRLRGAATELMTNSPEDFAALIRMANGCIGRAAQLLGDTERIPMLEGRRFAADVCNLLAQRTRSDELLGALLAAGTKRTDVMARLRLLTVALRDLLLLGYHEEATLLFFTDARSAVELSSRFTAHRLLACINAVEDTLTALAANGNVRLLLFRLHGRLTQT